MIRSLHREDHSAGGSQIALIVDSRALYAYPDEDDSDHEASLRLFESHPGPLLVPQLVIAEVTYLIETRLWRPDSVRTSSKSTSIRHI
jgi:predicted nucleic acid-binding protein